MLNTHTTARSVELPALKIADGTLAGLKWLALCLMVGDHINKYLLHESVPLLFNAGRIAAPLFAFVLAFNLARPMARECGVYARTLNRLLVAGGLATPAFIWLGGLAWGAYPLNILFMLAAAVAVIALLDNGRKASAVALFLVSGAFVEFWWPAIMFCLASWWYCRRPNIRALAAGIASCAALALINGNHWALAVLPLIYGASLVQIDAPRARLFFYGFYPLHLVILCLVRLAIAPNI